MPTDSRGKDFTTRTGCGGQPACSTAARRDQLAPYRDGPTRPRSSVRHAKLPRGKVIERVFGLLQNYLESEPGYAGRDETHDKFETSAGADLPCAERQSGAIRVLFVGSRVPATARGDRRQIQQRATRGKILPRSESKRSV